MSFLYTSVYAFLRILLLILKPFLSKKLQHWIDLRNQKLILSEKMNSAAPRVWIHAASGEIEYAKAVIRELKTARPDCNILVSYSSPSAPKLFKNIELLVTQFFPLGWDTAACNQHLIEQIQPDVLIFSRTDFWPDLVKTAHKNNIKLGLISFYPSWNFLNKFWYTHILNYFTFITCVDQNSTQLLKNLLPHTQVKHIPDTRFDQVLFRLDQPSTIRLNQTQKKIVFGSTWPEDELVLKSCLNHILEKKYAIIWAPHEVKYAQNLIEELKKHYPDKKTLILSQTSPFDLETQHFDFLIIDKIGYLADLYRFSDLSFIGGSFVKRVHSVMEPLCALNPVLVGPYYKNNPEAVLFKEKGFVKKVTSAEEFLQRFDELDNPSQLKENLATEIQMYKHGSLETVKLIEDLL